MYDNFSTQANEANKYLKKAGFVLKEKRGADEFNSGNAMYTYNQIWER